MERPPNSPSACLIAASVSCCHVFITASTAVCSCDTQQRQTASKECKFHSRNYCVCLDENCHYSMNHYVAFKHSQAFMWMHSTELQFCRNNSLSKWMCALFFFYWQSFSITRWLNPGCYSKNFFISLNLKNKKREVSIKLHHYIIIPPMCAGNIVEAESGERSEVLFQRIQFPSHSCKRGWGDRYSPRTLCVSQTSLGLAQEEAQLIGLWGPPCSYCWRLGLCVCVCVQGYMWVGSMWTEGGMV